MMKLLVAALLGTAQAVDFTDCDTASLAANGSFGTVFANATWDTSLFFSVSPTDDSRSYPLIAFMHGSTGT